PEPGVLDDHLSDAGAIRRRDDRSRGRGSRAPGTAAPRRVSASVAPSRVVLLAGGVGGARLAHGLQAHLGSGLSVVVNTADSLERHGLLVSPDHDTVMYTLAGIANRAWGWGVEGETFAASAQLARLGEEARFRLGDRDLATA